jgi:radical SAM protein with 4Fe4S-binding SPASM domain
MLKSELIAKKINAKIAGWAKDQPKLVVAIDGYAGSGKTTVANFITRQNTKVLVVHLDDFINHINSYPSKKCIGCPQINSCGGGCPLMWTVYDAQTSIPGW